MEVPDVVNENTGAFRSEFSMYKFVEDFVLSVKYVSRSIWDIPNTQASLTVYLKFNRMS